MGGSTCPDADTSASSHREAHPSARFVPEPGSRAPRTFNPIISIMRLHLPKTLLAAVLAACAALPAGAKITETTLTSLTVQGVTLPTAPEGQDTVYKQIVTNNADSCDTLSDATATFLKSNGNSEAAQRFKVTSAATVENAGTLVIAESTVNGEKTNAGQLYLSRWSGSHIDNELNITNDIIIGKSNAGSAIRLSDANTDDRIITLSGTITLAQDAQIGVDSNVTSGHARITGSVSGSGKTLTIAAGDSGSGVLNMGDGSTDKTLTLGGLTVADETSVILNYETATIGTLTLNSTATNAFILSGGTTTVSTVSGSGSILLNGGTLAVSDTGDFSISGVKFAGGVLDVSSVTGTLTVGGTWTGDFVEKSVKVINANNATIAGSLATSLNPSSLLNYMYKAGNADAGESASSVYRVRREFITATATVDSTQKNRIVIESVTGADGSTEFSNVGLSDLLAGDKVTINGLTGWIGQNGANTILADLKFTGENHINNGSSDNNWITYSGAITGDGTLSYEWATKAYTYNFNGDLSGFTGTISDTTTLNVTIGGTPATEAAKEVNATIDIAGILTVNRETTFTKGFTAKQLNGNQKIVFNGDQTINCTQDGDFSQNIDVKTGKLTVQGSVKTSRELDLSGPDTSRYNGTVEVATAGKLTIDSSIWGLAETSKILLQEGGMLKWNGLEITGKTAVENVETGLKFGATDKLKMDIGNHTVTNSVITYTGTDERTLSWKLVDTDLNVESGTVNLAGNSIGGNLTINAGTVKSSIGSNKGIVGAHTVTINAGGTLEATGIDVFGWEAGQKCTKITMQGAQDAIAKVILNNTDSRWQTTFGTDVLLKGYATIDGTSAFKTTAGGKIEATGTNNVISAAMCVKDDVEVNVTGATDTLQIDNIQYFHDTEANTDSSGTVSVTGEGTLNVGAVTRSALKNTGSGSVKITGAVVASTISNTGSGSVTLSGTTDSATKLISSGSNGSLAAQGVSSLAEVKAENGGSITLRMAAADDLTAVSLTDLVIGNGSSVSVQVSDGTDGGTASVDNITVGQGTTLGANLTLGEGAGMSFNVAGLTGADGEAAICTLTGSLTLGLNVELHLLNLGMLEKGKSITLFTGVTGFTYSGAASVATLSDDDISTGTVNVDASEIFGNVDSGFFTVKYDGNNVILTASSNVPEPTTATLSLLALMGLAARRRRCKA